MVIIARRMINRKFVLYASGRMSRLGLGYCPGCPLGRFSGHPEPRYMLGLVASESWRELGTWARALRTWGYGHSQPPIKALGGALHEYPHQRIVAAVAPAATPDAASIELCTRLRQWSLHDTSSVLRLGGRHEPTISSRTPCVGEYMPRSSIASGFRSA